MVLRYVILNESWLPASLDELDNWENIVCLIGWLFVNESSPDRAALSDRKQRMVLSGGPNYGLAPPQHEVYRGVDRTIDEVAKGIAVPIDVPCGEPIVGRTNDAWKS